MIFNVTELVINSICKKNVLSINAQKQNWLDIDFWSTEKINKFYDTANVFSCNYACNFISLRLQIASSTIH